MAGLEPAAMGGAHLALPSSELHDHINCFRAGETHAQLRSECGSYIVRARSLTKLATSAPDQECDCLANPVANFIDNIIWVCGFISDGKRIINRRELWTQIQLSNQLAHWWSRLELNQRHGDFHSPALPTELQNHNTLSFYATTMIFAGCASLLHRTRNNGHNFEASGIWTLHLQWTRCHRCFAIKRSLHINGRYCYAPAKALTIYQPCGKTTGLM